jgi:hypothetical protein
MEDLSSISDLIHNSLTHSIDNLLSEFHILEFFLNLIDQELSKTPIGDPLILLIFRIFDSLTRFSDFCLRQLSSVPSRFPRLISSSVCIIPTGFFLRRICQSDPKFPLFLILELNFFNILIDLVHNSQYSLEYLGHLFNILAIIIERVDVCWGGFRPEFGSIWELPLEIIGLYFGSNEPLIIPSVLDAFNELLLKWPVDLSLIFTHEIENRLLNLTAIAHTIPEVSFQILRNCLKIWQQIIHIGAASTNGSILVRDGILPKLVSTLADQLNRFDGLQEKILFLVANIAYYPESNIGESIYRFLMDQFHLVSFRKKESLILIFCNLSIIHPNQIIEIGKYEEFLIEALYTVEGSTKSIDIQKAFLRALYRLFSEDNDVVKVFDRQEIESFLREKIEESNHEIGELAEKLIDNFFRYPVLDETVFTGRLFIEN